MKSLGKTIVKGLLIATLFTTGSIGLSTLGISSISKVEAATYNQVNEYLVSKGYIVRELVPTEKYNWRATTIKDGKLYETIVYCNESSIIGHVDNPL